jgi:hypothetical protein
MKTACHGSGRRATRHVAFLAIALGLQSGAASAQGSRSAGAARAGGPAPGADISLVERFDEDGDGRLDASERAAARAWLATYRPGDGIGGRGPEDLAPASPGVRLSPAEVRVYQDERFYDTGTLRTIFLELENPDWEAELDAFYGTDVEVPATVTIDGRRYPDVGVRFRGATSFRAVPAGSKRPLNLSFDFVHDGQDVGGYRTLNLLNAFGDPTFMRSVLYSEIARRYLPAPKVNFVRVVINGESWGVYASQQQFNRDFLRDFFPTADGARWKVPGTQSGRAGMQYLGEDPAAYRAHYEIRSRDDPERWHDLIELTRVLDETPPERLEGALSPILDVDGTLRFLALEVALGNPDSYWSRGSDYTLYQSPEGRFHVIPHDFNEALGSEIFGAGGGPELDPLVALDDPRKPLRSKLLAVPDLRARYLAYVEEIARSWLDREVAGALVDGYRELIEADVRRDTRKLYTFEAFEAGLGTLKRYLERRRSYLLDPR